MTTTRIVLLLALLALAVPAAAGAAYDENTNYLNAYGRTVDHFSAPNRTIQNALTSAQRALFLAGEADRIPGRSAQQAGAWPWNGDIERGGYDAQGDWTGTKIEFEFTNKRGLKLAATLWAPTNAMLKEAGLKRPLAGLVYSGGVISAQPMYYWFAQEMARNGYMVLTYDVSGQGRSEGNSTGNAPGDLRDALDFFVSTPEQPYSTAAGETYAFNPLYEDLDRDRIGTAGHSMGAGAVQTVADHCGVVKAISAHSDLQSSYVPAGTTPAGACGPRKAVPVQGQGADYENFVFPPVPSPGADPKGKIGAVAPIAATGTDVQEVVIESGTHMAWSHVTWAYTASWSEQVAFHYALGWFDRYLQDDKRRGGLTGTERITSVFKSDAEGHGVSKKFTSAYSLDKGKLACADMLAGTGCTKAAKRARRRAARMRR